MVHKKLYSLISFLITVCLMNLVSYGAGFAVRNQSASGVGSALSSNTVNTKRASGSFANPAIMSFFKNKSLSIGLNHTQPDVKIKSGNAYYKKKSGLITALCAILESENGDQCSASMLEAIEARNRETGGAEMGDAANIPSVYYIHPISDKYTLGVSFTVPWATNTEYATNWIGSYHALATKLTTYNLSFLGSTKINENLNVGFALSLQKADGVLSSAAEWSLARVKLNLPITPGEHKDQDVEVKFKGTDNNYGFVLGLTYQAMESLLVGLSYRSSIKHNAKGKIDYTAIDNVKCSTYPGSCRKGVDGSLALASPAVISLGTAYSYSPHTSFYFNMTHTSWSVLKELILKQNGVDLSVTDLKYKDSNYFAIGAEHLYTDNLTLRGGVATEQGVATDAYRTPRTPDSDRTILGLGLGYAWGSYDFDLGFEYYTFKKAKIDLKGGDGVNAGRGDLSAEVETSAYVVMLGTSYAI